MKTTLRSGTTIALMSAALFAAACSKAKDNPSAGAGDMKEMKADKEMKQDMKEPAKPAAADPANSGAAPAAPAAGGDTAAAAPQPEKMAKVHCGGVNACKGKSGCKTAGNACAGQNGCKGQGYVELSAEECQAKGGKVLADAK